MSNKPELEDLKGLAEAAKVASADVTPAVRVPEAMLTPESQAATNALITSAVRAVFESLAPMLASMALTPEKMAEAEKLRRAPDPVAVARSIREKQLMMADLRAAEEQKIASQSACSHQHANGSWAWHTTHNFVDRQPRFSCPHCALWCHPREWRIGAPTETEPRGHAYIQPEHPLYAQAFKAMANKGV